MVRNSDGQIWYRRYFAGVSEVGRALAWAAGNTSWSCKGATDVSGWSQCRKPTAEELAGNA